MVFLDMVMAWGARHFGQESPPFRPSLVNPVGEAVAVIVDKNFPDEELNEQLAKGIERFPDAVWVVRSTDARARDALVALGVEPVESALNPYFKAFRPDAKLVDVRKQYRDGEILATCSRIVVFKDKASATSKFWADQDNDRVRVIEHGKAKRRYKRGRNPNV